MYSRMELSVLRQIALGNNSISRIAPVLKKSTTQIYRLSSTLRSKGEIILEDGFLIPQMRTHLTMLLQILEESEDVTLPLSGHGINILHSMLSPIRASEITEKLGIHQTSVSTKIREMMELSMVSKEGTSYSINDKVWPELRPFLIEYHIFSETNDINIPPGSKIYEKNVDYIIFSTNYSTDCEKTAFSRFTEFGMKIHTPIDYYCYGKKELTVADVFEHSLSVSVQTGDWRDKMMALIFYVMHKSELNEVQHPLKNEMDIVLSGEKISGWVSLSEMQERADIYNLKLE